MYLVLKREYKMNTIKQIYTHGKTQQCTIFKCNSTNKIRFVKDEKTMLISQNVEGDISLPANEVLDFCLSALNAYACFDDELKNKNLEITVTIKER